MARGQARPDNARVADILSDIADLLEIQGEVLFKILAYRRASHEIRTLARDVADLAGEGSLTDLPGIGASIADKVAEIIRTGTCEFCEELKLSFPPSLITLMEIQGVGPKKAKILYDELHITSLDQLEEAVARHRLHELKGFGDKTEENILRGIQLHRSHHERILLSEAYPLARRLIGELRANTAVLDAEPGGSLRRMQETIGDIDILASSERPAEVAEAFAELPEVDSVLAKGETKVSVIVGSGLQVDLRIVGPESWGAALQYFTGSKDHNVRLRERAKDLGLKLNEYGVERIDDKVRVAGATEQEVYAALGLDWIPATMRLDKGEIALAESHALPRLVALDDIRGDLHVHTDLSDGMDGLERLFEKASELGYEYLAITDHAEQLRVAHGLSVERLEASIAQIAAFNERHPGFTFLSGAELNIGNHGELDYPDDFLARLDVVVASVHTGFNQDKKQLTARTIAAIENPHVDIVAHPTGRILGKREPFAIDIEAVVSAAARTGTALELNSYPDRLDLKDDHLRLAREAGARIAVNTDSHAADQLAYILYGVATAQRGALTREDVVNTLPLAKLKNWLDR